MMGYVVTLAVFLVLPGMKDPIEYQEVQSSVTECSLKAAEMVAKAPAELTKGGQLQVTCAVSVPKSENP